VLAAKRAQQAARLRRLRPLVARADLHSTAVYTTLTPALTTRKEPWYALQTARPRQELKRYCHALSVKWVIACLFTGQGPLALSVGVIGASPWSSNESQTGFLFVALTV